MADLFEKVKVMGQKAALTAQQYGETALQWKMKLLKKQQQKLRQKLAARKAEKVFSEFGLEIYRLIKEGVTDWQNAPSVKEKLEKMKLAEADIAQFNQIIEEIERAFEEKKREIREKFEARKKKLESSEAAQEQTEKPEEPAE
ncbi:hypothetical protein [Thermodesulforhabdus norvegica]|uniref:Uncharacterized protein n=1 Tax=Thermodesulforhabdus norvegica TaxID=39841 RepID=A0A1I4QQ37_9BACT|nr:hypothetical protein [Thermodesulforhabdus norvegica]SFM41826.1 hypothetical protein SAMN05660836_00145 [Thermodesulforhabdus norvegica]